MSWVNADDIDRTAKILVDTNRAASLGEAQRMLRSFVLQVAVGPDLADDAAAQAALITVVNTAARAFLGGVHVHLARDSVLRTGWSDGLSASAAVTKYGGQIVGRLSSEHPTLTLGMKASVGKPVLHLTWRGWAGGTVESPDHLLRGRAGSELAGVAAAALGVSEIFQHMTGNNLAGRRDVGLSLWRPDLDWTDREAVGPALAYLPAAVWLLGLGHLGQAYAWTLGLLPYARSHDVEVGLVDFDVVVRGNASTQMLVTSGDFGRRKTRVVADTLEARGFTTRIVERVFDEHFHPVTHADRLRHEPRVALAGFDSVEPRRRLGLHRFDRIVDAGLGNGAEYLDTVVHSFPAAGDPSTVFGGPRQEPSRPLRPAYEGEVERLVAAGLDESAARCGMVNVAGITVGAAFAGALTSTIVIADLLRMLHDDGASFSVISLDLRAPDARRAVRSAEPETVALAFTEARR